MPPNWLLWARELASIAQTGLYYATEPNFAGDAFDAERYRDVQRIAQQMLAAGFDVEPDQMTVALGDDVGHVTPKLDIRGAVFDGDRVLLVQEHADDDRWTLPGGWVDVNEPPSQAVEREFEEETGLQVKALRLLALWDRDRHDHPPHPHSIYKIVFTCEIVGGARQRTTLETAEPTFWPVADPPPLSQGRVTCAQLQQILALHHEPHGGALFD